MTASVSLSAASRSTTQSISIDETVFGSSGPGPIAQVNFDSALGIPNGYSLGGRSADIFTISAKGAISFTSQSLTGQSARPPVGEHSFFVETIVINDVGQSQTIRTGTVTLTVNAVNEKPSFLISQAHDAVPENTSHDVKLATVSLHHPGHPLNWIPDGLDSSE